MLLWWLFVIYHLHLWKIWKKCKVNHKKVSGNYVSLSHRPQNTQWLIAESAQLFQIHSVNSKNCEVRGHRFSLNQNSNFSQQDTQEEKNCAQHDRKTEKQKEKDTKI